MKRICVVLACLLLLTGCLVLAEEEQACEAVAAMSASYEELGGLPAAVNETDEMETEPFVPDTLDRMIIGTDDRKTIYNTSEYPYSAIGLMEVHARCGHEWQATGCMISERGFLTGSHCLVCTKDGKTADRITIYFGYDNSNGSYLYKYNKGTRYWYGTDFRNSDGTYSYGGHTNDDYAYVLLEEDVGNRTGWFGMTWLSDDDLLYSVNSLTGYRDGYLKKGIGTVKRIGDTVINYDNDGMAGNSGCPVYNDDYYVVAIHIAENQTMVTNIGRRVTYDLYKEMKSNGLFD